MPVGATEVLSALQQIAAAINKQTALANKIGPPYTGASPQLAARFSAPLRSPDGYLDMPGPDGKTVRVPYYNA